MQLGRIPIFILIISLVLGLAKANSQSSGTNLLEFQYGNIPGADDKSFPSIFDRTTIAYRKSGIRALITVEQYHSEYSDRNYINLAQGLVQYKKKKWDLKLGNIYETIGRGSLLRAFEIKGAVIEELGFRSRQYFHRDFLGASVKYRTKKLTIQAIRADVLNILAPTFSREDRRTDLISSLSLTYNYVKKHKFGINIMNHENANGNANNFGSILLDGPIAGPFSYYVEWANGLTQSDRYALYGGLTGYIGGVSINFELKSYRDFIIGSGINEPPALIQDQTYRVLNRSTHVSNPSDEDGYQIDLSYTFNNGMILVFNHALANNAVGSTSFVFQEFFIELNASFTKHIDSKIFLDYAKDPFKDQDNRFSLGFYNTILVSKKLNIISEIELQRFERFGAKVNNQSILIGLNLASKYSISLLFEHTNDPFLLLDINSSNRKYLGLNASYKPNYKNSIQLFIGERQGGPACSSGVCYEILDFKGFETRWTTRF